MNILRALAVIVLGFVLGGQVAMAQQQCLADAWKAYNEKNYTGAISSADDCVQNFGTKASKEQADLERAKEKTPPTGAVDNAYDKKKINDRWAVNDVSTSYFVKGESAESLMKSSKSSKDKQKYKEMACSAYQSAAKLTYGRCWDPKGWFWSPAEAASDHLGVCN